MWNILNRERKYLTTDKRESARKTTLKKLKNITKKKDQNEVIISLQTLLRTFFKTYFNITYSFTNEELSDEITNKKIDKYLKKKIIRLIERLNEAHYSKDHTKEEITSILQDTKQIISLM